jgi:hypothetical protein
MRRDSLNKYSKKLAVRSSYIDLPFGDSCCNNLDNREKQLMIVAMNFKKCVVKSEFGLFLF